MINFFKTLNPLSIIWLAVILFVLRLGLLAHLPGKIDAAYAASFGKLLLTQHLFLTLSPLANVLIAALFVFAQALILNHLVNHFNLLGKPSFLPALMYVTVSGLFAPFLVLSAPLICNFLVLWMFFKLLGFYKSKDSKAAAFDLGMMVAAGSLIYLPFIYFLVLIWISLFIFRPFNWREWITCIFGYAVIFLFVAVYYYLSNSLSFFGAIWMPLATHFPVNVTINYLNYVILIPVFLILILCFFKLRQNVVFNIPHRRCNFLYQGRISAKPFFIVCYPCCNFFRLLFFTRVAQVVLRNTVFIAAYWLGLLPV
jgi:hypothetical protein